MTKLFFSYRLRTVAVLFTLLIGVGFFVDIVPTASDAPTTRLSQVATERPEIQATSPVTLTWLSTLHTAEDARRVDVENQVIEAFNASQDEIELELIIIEDFFYLDFSTSLPELPPIDIVGPLGIMTANEQHGQWLDLQALVDSSEYDLSVYEPAILDMYRTDAGELLAVPFSVFPTVLYYNRGLFDEAGLNYPPDDFGQAYVWPDGSQAEWNYKTMAEIAKILTLDENGNDATTQGFDPKQIVQFGFTFQWSYMQQMWTHLQPEDIYDENSHTIAFPYSWQIGTDWLYDALWELHFMPNMSETRSETQGYGNNFASGNLAMTIVPIWYSCCLGDSVGQFDWDIAVVPRSFDGEYHVVVDDYAFFVPKDLQYPQEALVVISYLNNEATEALAPVYGMFPAHPDYQAAYVDNLATTYPFVSNWSILRSSLSYINSYNFHHGSFFPNQRDGTNRLLEFFNLLFGDSGAGLDIDAELDALETDLNLITNQ